MAAFRAWHQLISTAVLNSQAWVKSFLQVAAKEAEAAELWANTAATSKFAEWVSDGLVSG